mmetsp:Transcript_26028/g.82998  ORF Transcript_26028/g.82998 Transcript_26028/m.82998 type:complete len:628 (+) Transcript_26028:4116-5999(+)
MLLGVRHVMVAPGGWGLGRPTQPSGLNRLAFGSQNTHRAVVPASTAGSAMENLIGALRLLTVSAELRSARPPMASASPPPAWRAPRRRLPTLPTLSTASCSIPLTTLEATPFTATTSLCGLNAVVITRTSTWEPGGTGTESKNEAGKAAWLVDGGGGEMGPWRKLASAVATSREASSWMLGPDSCTGGSPGCVPESATVENTSSESTTLVWTTLEAAWLLSSPEPVMTLALATLSSVSKMSLKTCSSRRPFELTPGSPSPANPAWRLVMLPRMLSVADNICSCDSTPTSRGTLASWEMIEDERSTPATEGACKASAAATCAMSLPRVSLRMASSSGVSEVGVGAGVAGAVGAVAGGRVGGSVGAATGAAVGWARTSALSKTAPAASFAADADAKLAASADGAALGWSATARVASRACACWSVALASSTAATCSALAPPPAAAAETTASAAETAWAAADTATAAAGPTSVTLAGSASAAAMLAVTVSRASRDAVAASTLSFSTSTGWVAFSALATTALVASWAADAAARLAASANGSAVGRSAAARVVSRACACWSVALASSTAATCFGVGLPPAAEMTASAAETASAAADTAASAAGATAAAAAGSAMAAATLVVTASKATRDSAAA